MDKEVGIWAKLKHPHILRFLGCCSFADPPFIVCDYMENGNINDHLRREPEANRCRLVSNCGKYVREDMLIITVPVLAL